MNHRVRGAAHVSVMWVIFLLVLLFSAVGFLYIYVSERAAKEEQIASLTADRERLSKVNEDVTEQLQKLSAAVGFVDPAGASPFSNVTQIEGQIATLGSNYDFLGGSATDLKRTLEALVTNRDALAQQISELKQQLQAAEAARQAAQTNLTDQVAAKDAELDQVRQQLQDERDRAANQEQQDADRLASLQTQLQDAEARVRSTQEEADQKLAATTSELHVKDGRITELARKLEFVRDTDRPDGEVLAVSSVGTCYVDRGKADLLRRQTRFQVFRYGKGGRVEPKGLIEIRQVGETESEAGIVQLYDEFDPIVAGDLIAAPVYDPEMPREFVLVGRFPSGFSKEFVADRLRSLGAEVSDSVTPSTDFLVLGLSEIVTDEDAGEGAGDPTQTEDYQLAAKYQVQVLPVGELLDYLRYD